MNSDWFMYKLPIDWFQMQLQIVTPYFTNINRSLITSAVIYQLKTPNQSCNRSNPLKISKKEPAPKCALALSIAYHSIKIRGVSCGWQMCYDVQWRWWWWVCRVKTNHKSVLGCAAAACDVVYHTNKYIVNDLWTECAVIWCLERKRQYDALAWH